MRHKDVLGFILPPVIIVAVLGGCTPSEENVDGGQEAPPFPETARFATGCLAGLGRGAHGLHEGDSGLVGTLVVLLLRRFILHAPQQLRPLARVEIGEHNRNDPLQLIRERQTH